MKRFKEVIGLPVLYKTTGKVIGWVKSVDYSPGDEYISGLFIDRGGLKRMGYLKREMLSKVGEKAVISCTNSLLRPPKRHICRTKPRAFMPDGSEVGIVTDFLVEESNCAVSMIEVGRSLTEDLLYGRDDISHFALMEFSTDIMIWPDRMDKRQIPKKDEEVRT